MLVDEMEAAAYDLIWAEESLVEVVEKGRHFCQSAKPSAPVEPVAHEERPVI